MMSITRRVRYHKFDRTMFGFLVSGDDWLSRQLLPGQEVAWAGSC